MNGTARPAMHSDEPIQKNAADRFERRGLASEIAEVAATADPPLVLGVHGDWGSGKTSFMRQVQDALAQAGHAERIVTVWFEAWRYQNEPAPLAALLQEMRRSFPPFEKAKSKAAKLGKVAFASVMDSLDKAAKLVGIESLPFSPEKIKALGEQWEKERMEVGSASDTIRGFLEEAIENLLPVPAKGKSTPRVIVFIDDLDRCLPDMAYRLLEGLKIYLSLKNCVFVLAMNQQIVIKAIATAMKKEDHEPQVKLEAEAYLEKLCTNIWRLPPPPDPVNYLIELLDKSDSEPALAIALAAGKVPQGFLPPNPRRIKALANLYNRLWRRARGKPGFAVDGLVPLRLLAMAYVYQFHSDLFQRWRHTHDFFSAMVDWLREPVESLGEGAKDKAGKASPFAGLILPTGERGDPDAAVGAYATISHYPDPTAPGVFWIAPLWQRPGPLMNDVAKDYLPLLGLDAP